MTLTTSEYAAVAGLLLVISIAGMYWHVRCTVALKKTADMKETLRILHQQRNAGIVAAIFLALALKNAVQALAAW